MVFPLYMDDLLTTEKNQDLIMDKGGAKLLAKMVTKTDDPQTLRMVAGAFANLCGNGEQQIYNFGSDDFPVSDNASILFFCQLSIFINEILVDNKIIPKNNTIRPCLVYMG